MYRGCAEFFEALSTLLFTLGVQTVNVIRISSFRQTFAMFLTTWCKQTVLNKEHRRPLNGEMRECISPPKQPGYKKKNVDLFKISKYLANEASEL